MINEIYPDNHLEILEESIPAIIEELERQVEDAPGFPFPDPVLKAFAKAILDLCDNNNFVETIIEMAEARLSTGKNIEPSNFVLMLQNCVQYALIDPRAPDIYPKLYDDPLLYADTVESLLRESGSYGEFWTNIMIRDPRNNIPQRYKPEQIISQLIQPRFGHDFSILDGGTSEMLGPKLLYSKNHGFRPLIVVDDENDVLGSVNWASTRRFNRVLDKRLAYGKVIGVDKLPILDRKHPAFEDTTAFWTYSNSFYPSELMQEKKVKEYLELREERVDNVQFYESDMVTMDTDKLKTKTGLEKFSIVVLSHMLYQMEPEQVSAVRQNAYDLLDKGGIIVYQEFAHTNEQKQLTFEGNWLPWCERTMVELMEDKGKIYDLFLWSDRRCNMLKVLNPELLSYLAA